MKERNESKIVDLRVEVEPIGAEDQEIQKACLPGESKLEKHSSVIQGVNSPMSKPR